ncbi:Ger(x)C family spore germination protein [Sutcliffiella horikoshii]|uniref:Ger(x)C family spore germination protein n=1 Tax=Sutcliffiella horikoshii TaxID=79883 RepID=UPI003850006B
MMKYLYMVFALLAVTSVFWGGDDKLELNDKALSFVTSIDYIDEEFVVGIQLINPAAISGKTQLPHSPYIVYEARGSTIDSAIDQLTSYVSRNLDMRHLKVIVVGMDAAKQGKLREIMNYALRRTEIPVGVVMVLSKDTNAIDLLNTYSPIEGFTAFDISKTMRRVEKASLTTLMEVNIVTIQEGKDFTIPFISIMGDVEKGGSKENYETTSPVHLYYSGIGAFKNEKLVVELSYIQSLYLALLEKHTSELTVVSSCPTDENTFTYRIYDGKTKSENIKQSEGNLQYSFNIQATGEIVQYNCSLTLNNPNNNNKIKMEIQKEINENIQELFVLSKENNTDFMGLGSLLRKKNNHKWEEIKKNWDAELQKAEIKITTDLDFQNIGKYDATR